MWIVGAAAVAVIATVMGRAEPIECERSSQDPTDGVCIANNHRIQLANIVGLSLETMTTTSRPAPPPRPAGSMGGRVRQPTATSGHSMSRLMLITQTNEIPLETGWHYSIFDRRPQLVARFNAYRAGAAKSFPEPGRAWRYDMFIAIVVVLAALVIRAALRRRGGAVLEIDEGSRTMVVSRDGASAVRLMLVPPPRPIVLTDDKGNETLCLLHDNTRTLLVELTSSKARTGVMIDRVAHFLRSNEPI